LKVIKLPQSRVKRELTSIFRKIENGALDMVEVTRNDRGIACIVRYGGDYQPPREALDDLGKWFANNICNGNAESISSLNKEEWGRFVSLIDNPPAPSNKLLAAVKKLDDESRSLGIFTNHRELASCNECDLYEDVDCHGFLFVTKGEESNKPVDLVFMEMDDQHVRCPLCGRIINCG